MPSRPVPPQVVGAAEIADLLHVSRQRVSQLTADKARQANGFPEPWLRLAMGKVWLLSDVQSWADGHRSAAAG